MVRFVVLLVWGLGCGVAAAEAVRIPLVEGLAFTSALAAKTGDREGVVTVARADEHAIAYSWTAIQPTPAGAPARLQFQRTVRAVDQAAATRLNGVFYSEDRADYPGYTAFTVSAAVYDALKAGAEVPFSVVSKDERSAGTAADLLATFAPRTIRLKGTLRRVGPVKSFALLFNGRRVGVPALTAAGHFEYRGDAFDQEFLILDQRDHPLILRVVTGADVYQVVRVDLLAIERAAAAGGAASGPATSVDGGARLPSGDGSPPTGAGNKGGPSTGAGSSAIDEVEESLRTRCRAELPGVFFDFAKADLTPESNAALAGLAALIVRHRDWTLAVEGHTDHVGTDAANQRLSEDRAAAVRRDLVGRGVAPEKLKTAGYGESRPVESNATLEGRARNRRVELVRECGRRP